MALFTTNLTIKTTRDMPDPQSFVDLLQPGSKYGLFPGELALYVDGAFGLKLYTLNANGSVTQIQASLDELADVNIDDPEQGEILQYNGTQWVNTAAPEGQVWGNVLEDLGDVSYSNLQIGDQLVRIDSEWTNQPNFTSLGIEELENVKVEFPLDGEVLMYKGDSGIWENDFQVYRLNDLVDVDIATSPPLDGDILLYDALENLWVPGAIAGGNVTTLIIDEGQPLPEAPLTSLGVSEINPNDVEGSGNFYWAVGPEETNTDWNKAVKAGQATFDDFADIDASDIQIGDSLQWGYSNGSYSFRPQKFVPLGVKIATGADTTGPFFEVNGYGEPNARYYTAAACDTGVLGLFPSRTRGEGEYVDMFYMGMYGMSDVEPGIHVSYDKVEDGWIHGLLKFPNDLRPDDRNGFYGIRPFDASKSHDFATQGPRDYFTDYGDGDGIYFAALISFYTDFPGTSFDLWDIGHLALYVDNGEVCVRHNGTQNPIIRTGLQLPSNEQNIKQTFHQIFVNVYDGFLSVFYNGNRLQDISFTSWDYVPLDTTTYVGPILGGNGFKGYMGDFRWVGPVGTGGLLNWEGQSERWDYGDRREGTWMSNSLGQYIDSGDRGTFIVSKGFEEEDYYVTGNFNYLSRFGRGELMLDLADVDGESFLNAPGRGVATWNPATRKIEWAAQEFSVEVTTQLRFASDVSPYDKLTGDNIKTGQTLVWDRSDLKFYPGSLVGSFRINEANDVNIGAGLYDGNILTWDASTRFWRPTNAPNQPAILLDELTDVNLSYNTPETGYTLIYSEALDEWVAAPAPWYGADEISELKDVDLTGLQDNDILAYNSNDQIWRPIKSPDSRVLNDLGDVDTVTRPPKEGQALEWVGTTWAPGSYAKGGASSLGELWDVNTAGAQPGDGLIWDGTYFKPQAIGAGRGDGGDFSVGHVLAGYVPGVYGGGDFDTEEVDMPVEQQGLVDGGLFV